MFINRLRTSLVPPTKTFLKNSKTVLSAAPQVINGSTNVAGVVQVQNYSYDCVDEKLASTNLLPSSSFPVKSTLSKTPRNVLEVKPKKLSSTGRISTPLLSTQKRGYATAGVPEKIAEVTANAPKEGVVTEDYLAGYMHDAAEYDDARQFAYYVSSVSRFFWATGIRLAVLKLLYTWGASADVLAVAKIEVDISQIPRGKTITITWRGKPIFIRHRTEEEIEIQQNTALSELKDPQPDSARTLDKNWSVLLAICTHLGCVPVTDAGAFNAFFCPCHGSHYDISGRIRIGPAPSNLEVPPHQFVDGGKTIVLG